MPQAIAATQVYVWTQVLGREGKRLTDHLDVVLTEIRAAGFPALEGFLDWFATPESAGRTAALLAEYRLRLPSVYTGGNLWDPEQAERTVARILDAAERLRTASPRLETIGITMNPDTRPERKTDAQLRTQAEWLNRLGAALKERGLALWLHNHDVEMREEARELRSNLDRTDPRLVGFCADVHWIWRGGGDPYRLLEEYAGRLGSLHLRNSRGGIWSETFGPGDIDYGRVARLLKARRFAGPLIVELAIEPGTPQTRPLVESARLSRAYLKQVFGV